MMVLKSDDFCFNPTIQLPQFEMQQQPQPPLLPQQQQLHERRTMKEELGSSPQPQPHLKPPTEMVKCPRCESSNTKFCYYNNYSLSQPRHFCKECRRYWTKGGSLRNVPVGGGIRKNKRTKPTTTSPHQLPACHSINDLPSSMPDHYPTPLFFPFAGNDSNLSPLPRQHLPDQHSPTSAPFFDMGHPHQHHHLSSLLGLELATSAPRHLPPVTSSASAFSLALDPYAALDWKSNQHKTSAGENDLQALAAPKLEEDACHASSSVVDQWSTANQEGLFDNYWHTNSWLEMPTPYSTTATTLLQEQ